MLETCEIILQGLQFPEGPAFDPEGNLWCVELHGGNLLSLRGGRAIRCPTGGKPNGLAFDSKGRAWFCDAEQNAIRVYDPKARSWETVVNTIDGEPLNKPNDLAFDGKGNLIFTCPGDSRTEPTGYIAVLRAGGSVEKIAQGFYFPNGLALSEDGQVLFVAETYRQRIWCGNWDGISLKEPQVWAENLGGKPGPDGLAVGKSNLVYAAVFGSGSVKAIDPQGKIKQVFPLPGNNPTNLAFDTHGTGELVVTEAEKGLLLRVPVQDQGVDLFA